MNRCVACEKRIASLGRLAPVGWKAFAWGPSSEDPLHFYVFPASTPKLKPNEVQELNVSKLCCLQNPQKREVLS